MSKPQGLTAILILFLLVAGLTMGRGAVALTVDEVARFVISMEELVPALKKQRKSAPASDASQGAVAGNWSGWHRDVTNVSEFGTVIARHGFNQAQWLGTANRVMNVVTAIATRQNRAKLEMKINAAERQVDQNTGLTEAEREAQHRQIALLRMRIQRAERVEQDEIKVVAPYMERIIKLFR